MSKEIYISSTPHETRLAIVEHDALTEIYYERENEYTLAGSIYNGRVTRVLPGMQSSFVDIGLERDAFLYITDFMEEAPDSAEFDTTSHGDAVPRAPRLPSPERMEEAGAKTEGGGGRSERGGRGRRGGRDRNSERDRNPEKQAVSEVEQRPVAEAPVAPVSEAADAGEAGEGAPGADGSRRWRGRRGRRRGRGGPGGQSGETAQANGGPADDGEGFEIDGAAASAAPEAPAVQAELIAAPVQTPREQGSRQQGRDGQRDQGRRDRPDRGDKRRDEGRGDQRPPRGPRGFEPSRTYGVESGESGTGPVDNAYPDEASGPLEPIILPGESLGKYRKGGDEPQAVKASDAVTVTLAPPANLYTVAAGWDGGAVLPGETLRRRPEGRQESGRQDSGRDNARREPRREREGRAETRNEGRADFRSNVPLPAPIPTPVSRVIRDAGGASVAETPEEQPEVARALHPEEYVATEILHEAATVEPVQAEAVPPVEVTSEPVAPVATEYEPDETASVSYRVEPLTRSEFRQGAPVMEEDEFAVEEGTALIEGLLDHEPVASPPAEHSIAHTITPQPDEIVETLHADVAPVALEIQAEPAEHEITSISAAGEMYSERVDLPETGVIEPETIEAADPGSPIQHEGAVLAGTFAPGAGALEEETLDDEDFYASTIHASSIEEMDDLDEETLEGAADLGTMLREMSIDQITRPAPEAGDEDDDLDDDDLEEDDLEEDDLEEGDLDEDEEEGSEADESEESEAQARAGSTEDAEFFEQQFGHAPANEGGEQPASGGRDAGRQSERKPRRDGGRRDGRRGRSDRSRNAGGAGDQERGGRSSHSGNGGGGRSRQSMQSTNMPAISDLLKPGQEILVQIAKEPIAKKGARITSHIALPGRFLVFMPTVNHTGVSRKIESDAERRRLKEILLSEKGEAAGGFIVRTAAAGASEEELRSDLRFLLNLWTDIKARSESSKSPALIYHDLNLIERILRDQVTDNFSAIWVDTESEYERVLRFLQRFQPALIRRVKLYSKETPLFEQFGITEEINKALRSKVWLKSGGSIVINQTEALVAIDINTGKFVGKTARLEDTIVKTNLDAIPEIVRQIRLRDLGGIIIIDFIDMDERKNRNKVMAALEEELKSDRAPSKVLQFNDFGLVAITRKRVKQSLERTLSTTCNVCVGTGMVKSPITVCNDIYVEMKKMHKHLDRGDVMLRVHPEVVKQLKVSGSKWLQEMEEMCGKTILVKSDPSLHPEQFDIH